MKMLAGSSLGNRGCTLNPLCGGKISGRIFQSPMDFESVSSDESNAYATATPLELFKTFTLYCR